MEVISNVVSIISRVCDPSMIIVIHILDILVRLHNILLGPLVSQQSHLLQIQDSSIESFIGVDLGLLLKEVVDDFVLDGGLGDGLGPVVVVELVPQL